MGLTTRADLQAWGRPSHSLLLSFSLTLSCPTPHRAQEKSNACIKAPPAAYNAAVSPILLVLAGGLVSKLCTRDAALNRDIGLAQAAAPIPDPACSPQPEPLFGDAAGDRALKLRGHQSAEPSHCYQPASPSYTPAPTFPTRPAAKALGKAVWVFDVFIFFTRQTLAGAILLFTLLCNVSACKKGWLGKRRRKKGCICEHTAQDGDVFAERELIPLPVKLRGKQGTIKRKMFP